MNLVVKSPTGNLFSAKGGVLKYLGWNPDYEAQLTLTPRNDDKAFGAMVLCGRINDTICIDTNKKMCGCFVNRRTNATQEFDMLHFAVIGADSKSIGEFCKTCDEKMLSRFTVIPYEPNDLYLIGALVHEFPATTDGEILTAAGSDKFKLDFFTHNIAEYPDTIWYDMAKCVNQAGEGFNAVASTPYDDGFSLRFLRKEYTADCDTCIMCEQYALELLGDGLTDGYVRAAEWYPVELETTELFRKKLCYDKPKVKILLADGSHCRVLRKFMGFWELVSARKCLWSSQTAADIRVTVFTPAGYGFTDSVAVMNFRGIRRGTQGAL